MLRRLFLALCLLTPAQSAPKAMPNNEHVILLHGLCRTSSSMKPLQKHLQQLGYTVHNLDYDSRTETIPHISQATLKPAFSETAGATRVHLVTHSMGGILVRDYLSRHSVANLGHVVMLAPPNHGSEVVDKIGHWRLFKWLNGPAGQQLGTSETGFIKSLPAPDFSFGIISGSRSINWINSCIIPGPDDGKVSTQSAQLPPAESRIIPATHTFIMKKQRTKRLVSHFLATGRFPENR